MERKKRKMKLSVDFQIQKPTLTHRRRRLILKAIVKSQPSPEETQRKINSQGARLDRRMKMSLEERATRRKALRAQTGIYAPMSEAEIKRLKGFRT